MEIHIGNRVAEVELKSKEGNKVLLTIDGKEFEVDIMIVENGYCSILHEGKSYNAELIRAENGRSYKVSTYFSSYPVEIVDTQAKYLRMRRKDENKPDNKIIAPMPGKVVKVLVKEGDNLLAGDTVVVIEAMKMQSNYKVNSDCCVKEVLVKEGDTVTNDQVLITLEFNKTEE